MTKIDYRHRAHQHLTAARTLFERADDELLAYVALELRKCMEALTYERAQAYLDDLPPRILSSSQPQKVMQFLLDIDPYADAEVTFQMSTEPAGTTETPNYLSLGTEKPLTLRQIKDHYHKMGFYLHIPTMAQVREGKDHDLARLRTAADHLIDTLDRLLGSGVWNLILPRGTATIDCLKCGATIKRRLNSLAEPGAPPAAKKAKMEVECFECDASYSLRLSSDGGVEWLPHLVDQPCPYGDCDGCLELWQRSVSPGAIFTCEKCKRDLRVALGLVNAG